MNDQIKINWYRCKVDRKVMSELMQPSNARGFLQVIPQLALFVERRSLATTIGLHELYHPVGELAAPRAHATTRLTLGILLWLLAFTTFRGD